MAPPKKKAVKRKKSTVTLPPFNYQPPTVYDLGVKPYLFIKCKICCTALPHLNFEWPAVPTEITLSAIKEAIAKRHGDSLSKITLYKGVVHPDHSLANASDATSLKDLGIEGVYMDGPDVALPLVTFYYDFSAARFDDAIATVEPETLSSKHDLQLKLYRKLTAPQPPATVRPTPGGAGFAAGAAAGAVAGAASGASRTTR